MKSIVLLLSIVFAQSGREFPTRAELLNAMGVEPITGNVSYRRHTDSGKWHVIELHDKFSGEADPSTGHTRSIYLVKSECDRIDSLVSGPDRADTVMKARSIGAAFIARIRPSSETWTLKSARLESGIRGVPRHVLMFYGLTTVNGYAVGPDAVSLTITVLQKSGVLASANLPYYDVHSTTDQIGESRARQIAEAYTFQKVSWDATGKRGRIVKLERFLALDKRHRPNVGQDPRRLVRAWRATFEKYGAYVTIDARDGSIIGKDRGGKPR